MAQNRTVFLHPLNALLLLSGAASAAWTLDWRPLLVVGVAEVVWAAVVLRSSPTAPPPSTTQVDEAEQAKLRTLNETLRRRFLVLDAVRRDIRRLGGENQILQDVGIERELAKVDKLLEGWLRLAARLSSSQAIAEDTDLERLVAAYESAASAERRAALGRRITEARAARASNDAAEEELQRVDDALHTVRDRMASLTTQASLAEPLDALLEGMGAAEGAARSLGDLERNRASAGRTEQPT